MSWLKGCEVCNTGLINHIDELVENGKISLNKACKLMEKEGKEKIGDLVYSAEMLRARYRYHKGLRDPTASPSAQGPKVAQIAQPSLPNHTEKVGQIVQSSLPNHTGKVGQNDQPTTIMPEATELSASHHIEAATTAHIESSSDFKTHFQSSS